MRLILCTGKHWHTCVVQVSLCFILDPYTWLVHSYRWAGALTDAILCNHLLDLKLSLCCIMTDLRLWEKWFCSLDVHSVMLVQCPIMWLWWTGEIVSDVRDLGIYIDWDVPMKTYVATTISGYDSILRQIRQWVSPAVGYYSHWSSRWCCRSATLYAYGLTGNHVDRDCSRSTDAVHVKVRSYNRAAPWVNFIGYEYVSG